MIYSLKLPIETLGNLILGLKRLIVYYVVMIKIVVHTDSCAEMITRFCESKDVEFFELVFPLIKNIDAHVAPLKFDAFNEIEYLSTSSVSNAHVNEHRRSKRGKTEIVLDQIL